MDKILVSINCITYNHENYISDAIESFLIQKTNFKYEILIHDDASTDKTADIIREYEKRYPDVINPIYQKENQYSKGLKASQINNKRAKGKYSAICEGDDYWSDPYKLQKQVDYLEENPSFSVCVHAATVIDADSKEVISKVRPSRQNKEFRIEDIIEGGGGLFPTNSIVYRSDMGDIRPGFYYKNKTSFGDYQFIILLAMIGKIYYIDEFMSVYRYNVPGSWTSKNMFDIKKVSNHVEEINSMLEEFNEYTEYVYDDLIQKTKKRNKFNLLMKQSKLKEAKTGKLKKYYDTLSLKRKILINLKYYSPNIHRKLFLIKEKLYNAKPKY